MLHFTSALNSVLCLLTAPVCEFRGHGNNARSLEGGCGGAQRRFGAQMWKEGAGLMPGPLDSLERL